MGWPPFEQFVDLLMVLVCWSTCYHLTHTQTDKELLVDALTSLHVVNLSLKYHQTLTDKKLRLPVKLLAEPFRRLS